MSHLYFSLSMMFTLGFSGLALNRKHLLLALLCLETMMLLLYISTALWASQTGDIATTAIPVYVLAFSACEAGTGLALLVATSRTHATDHLENLNILQC
uniref:NADH-ubiquinone oxidoreductase chain 4L n=1 Tax=Eurypharynx pelecanoides TaxID=55117 RepID=Q76MN3_EURPE|nr:NADH dehydrogenase subunit 4L [Eurypharynx pelecanoides]